MAMVSASVLGEALVAVQHEVHASVDFLHELAYEAEETVHGDAVP